MNKNSVQLKCLIFDIRIAKKYNILFSTILTEVLRIFKGAQRSQNTFLIFGSIFWPILFLGLLSLQPETLETFCFAFKLLFFF